MSRQLDSKYMQEKYKYVFTKTTTSVHSSNSHYSQKWEEAQMFMELMNG